MMAGNSFCLLAHLLKARVVDTDREVPVNILILLPAALMDLGGEILSNMGLVLSRDAATHDILECSAMVWCGLISVPVFGRRLKLFQWLGMIFIATGTLAGIGPRHIILLIN